MTIEGVLHRLNNVRKSSRGWMAQCPAHEDKSPSLSIAEGYEGRVLLKCFAGCSFREIAQALNLPRSDLPRPRKPPTFKPIDWRRLAHVFRLHAENHWIRGREVIEKIKEYDSSLWEGDEFDWMLDHVCRALKHLERAEYLEEWATRFMVRSIEERKPETKGGKS